MRRRRSAKAGVASPQDLEWNDEYVMADRLWISGPFDCDGHGPTSRLQEEGRHA